MKTIAFLLLLIFAPLLVQSQSCLPGGITFLTQEDVDNFIVNHPGCVEIEGSVYLLNTPVENLNSLINIKHIHGDMLITGNQNLTNLDGLANLETIGQVVRIQDNPALTNLDGLSKLSAVKGDFFYIGSNSALENLEGLSELDSISGIFQVWDIDLLTSLQGLEQLKKTGNTLAVFNNDLLESLDGLEGLTNVGYDLRIENNPLLEDISALNHPVAIDAALAIIGNSSLSDCAVKAVCDYVAAPVTSVFISANGAECISVQAVETACLTADDLPLIADKQLMLMPNPTSGLLHIVTAAEMPDKAQAMDISGKLIPLGIVENKVLDLSNLENGFYWIELSGRDWRKIMPVVKIGF